MTYVEKLEFASQHKLWHQEHLDWFEEVHLWENDLEEYKRSLKRVNDTLVDYAALVKQFKDEMINEEVHIGKHEFQMEADDTKQMMQEHDVCTKKHHDQRKAFNELRRFYHQFGILMHSFEKGMEAIDQLRPKENVN